MADHPVQEATGLLAAGNGNVLVLGDRSRTWYADYGTLAELFLWLADSNARIWIGGILPFDIGSVKVAKAVQVSLNMFSPMLPYDPLDPDFPTYDIPWMLEGMDLGVFLSKRNGTNERGAVILPSGLSAPVLVVDENKNYRWA